MSPKLSGAFFEDLVARVCSVLHPDCNFTVLPNSGRYKGGDITCDAVLFEVKARKKKQSLKQSPHALMTLCVYEPGADSIHVYFPFLPDRKRNFTVKYWPVVVHGEPCPYYAGEVRNYPALLVVNGRGYIGGLGVVVNNTFVGVRPCPKHPRIS